jgi:hypothetical protein
VDQAQGGLIRLLPGAENFFRSLTNVMFSHPAMLSSAGMNAKGGRL